MQIFIFVAKGCAIPMSFNEINLLHLLKQDDHKAFDAIFHLYYARVFNLAYRFLRSSSEAEEIVQQTFITVWENRQNIDLEKSFGGFILSIARHQCLNQLKKAVYRQRFIDLSLQNSEAAENNSETILNFEELQQLLKKAISELPPKRREIFILSREQELSYKEIAARLKIKESTINTQISKAIEFLRQRLKEYSFILFL